VPDNYAFVDRKSVLKRLKREKKKFGKLEKDTLIGAALPIRPHTGSRRLQYAGSPKGSVDAAPDDNGAAVSGGNGATAHRILARRMP
jgi:hypothetical protein